MTYDIPMKMNVQTYIEANGIEALQKEFNIVITDYPDRIVLNYDQIESPRFNPICDECRSLILRKGTWEVMARSFDRFYNVGEDKNTANFKVSSARIEEKIDGSLMSVYWDGDKWCIATRKMGFAEGTTVFGRTFEQIFQEAASKTSLWESLNDAESNKKFTWVFELVSPETRVVTPYPESKISLITARDNRSGSEMLGTTLDLCARVMRVNRPLSYKFSTIEETIEAANKLNAMDEGFVLVNENTNGSHWRIKCKNGKYLAIAHMRNNGGISPKRVLKLVMENETEEYLSYFECDKPYFDFVQEQYNEVVARLNSIANECMGIENQKDFALTITPKCQYKFETGVLFAARKEKKPIDKILASLGENKVAVGMNLRDMFAKKFKVNIEDDA